MIKRALHRGTGCTTPGDASRLLDTVHAVSKRQDKSVGFSDILFNTGDIVLFFQNAQHAVIALALFKQEFFVFRFG